MLDHIVYGTSSLLKRSVEGRDENTQPLGQWIWPVITLEGILFLPIIVFVTYTLSTLYPALAIVEDDDAPPTYQALSLAEDNAEEGGQAPAQAAGEFPVTASLRRVHALVRSLGSWRSVFHGLGTLIVVVIATALLQAILAAPLYPLHLAPLAAIPAHLALVQLHTVWVHVVITPPSRVPFWKRLPPFGKTFRATVRPIVLYAVAREVARGLPRLIFLAPQAQNSPLGLLFVPLVLLLWLVVEIPAQIALVRIQASLLPPDEDPIVPFDRSFGGRVSPVFSVGGAEGQGGKTHATLRDIWETLSRAAVWRVAKLMLKVAAAQILMWLSFGAIVFATSAVAGIQIPMGPGGSQG